MALNFDDLSISNDGLVRTYSLLFCTLSIFPNKLHISRFTGQISMLLLLVFIEMVSHKSLSSVSQSYSVEKTSGGLHEITLAGSNRSTQASEKKTTK